MGGNMAERCKTTGRDTSGLRPKWKPGESGNPHGRPPKPLCITHLLREYGIEKDSEKFAALAKLIWARALDGDMSCIKEILDRTEGKPVQSVKDLTENKDVEIVIGGRPFRVNNNHDPDAETPRQ